MPMKLSADARKIPLLPPFARKALAALCLLPALAALAPEAASAQGRYPERVFRHGGPRGPGVFVPLGIGIGIGILTAPRYHAPPDEVAPRRVRRPAYVVEDDDAPPPRRVRRPRYVEEDEAPPPRRLRRPRVVVEDEAPPPRRVRRPRLAIEKEAPAPRGPARLVREVAPKTAPETAAPPPAAVPFAARTVPPFQIPVASERRLRRAEIVVETASDLAPNRLNAMLRRQRLTILESAPLSLTGTVIHRVRIDDRRSVPAVIRALRADGTVRGAQPNHLYALTQETAAPQPASVPKDPNAVTVRLEPEAPPLQYVVQRMKLEMAHRLARGNAVKVAVIDSGIDTEHPELGGAVIARFDAVKATAPDTHGTAIAGAIAARGQLTGVAPGAFLLAARAFAPEAGGTTRNGTTYDILKSIDWAHKEGARIVNMSFAGPQDAALQRVIAVGVERGMVFVAAAGNDGPGAAPAYPAAEPGVIAVTATDAADMLFAKANRGPYITVAAPGVDVLLPAPGAAFALDTGTSVASAHVSGLIALLLERAPQLKVEEIRAILTRAAHKGPSPLPATEIGAGIIDAEQALVTMLAPPPEAKN